MHFMTSYDKFKVLDLSRIKYCYGCFTKVISKFCFSSLSGDTDGILFVSVKEFLNTAEVPHSIC